MPSARTAESIALGSVVVPGNLMVPEDTVGLVMIVDGGGRGHTDPCNLGLAQVFQQHRLATLMFDLLTEAEGQDRHKLLDVSLLAQRLQEAMHWTWHHPHLRPFPIGLFGSFIGAAATLVGAAQRPDLVAAVVSRSGRPDLASGCLAQVQAPTLMIVGARDTEVLALNQQALRKLRVPKRLEVVPGAGHLLAEPGALSTVGAFAAQWYDQYLPVKRPA